ncbi:MAG: hypothetical protein V4594_01825 [Bacteroidota bacterium]
MSHTEQGGQPVAHRITLGHVGHDLLHIFLHADKGIFSFVRRIVIEKGPYDRRE